VFTKFLSEPQNYIEHVSCDNESAKKEEVWLKMLLFGKNKATAKEWSRQTEERNESKKERK
jgi:hypothetical protein